MIADSFGENVRDTVSTASTVDPTGYVLPLAATSLAVRDERAVFPVLGSVNARARDVSIVEDRSQWDYPSVHAVAMVGGIPAAVGNGATSRSS